MAISETGGAEVASNSKHPAAPSMTFEDDGEARDRVELQDGYAIENVAHDAPVFDADEYDSGYGQMCAENGQMRARHGHVDGGAISPDDLIPQRDSASFKR